MPAPRLLKRLAIEPGEGAVFAWGAAALFLVGWADVSVKNVSETFFLKRVGVERLPLVFLVNSLLLVGTTYVFARLVTGRDRLRLLPVTLVGLGALLLPLWVLVRLDVTSVFALLVIASKQITSIALLVFWVAMGDLLYARQAKRLFAPMMTGVTLGTILGSFASKPLSAWLGIDGLLPLSAGVLLAGAGVALPLRRLRPARLERGWSTRSPGLGPAAGDGESVPALTRLWRESGLFRLLFVPALCSGLVGPMLYFQFSYVADLSTASGTGGEEQLLAFYAKFRGWIGFGVLLAQLGLTANLYRRIGVPLSAAMSPIVYLAGFVGLSVRLSLPAGVGAKAGAELVDNAVYDPALRVLYNLFPEPRRAGVSALLEGPIKRAGGALGNVVILAALGIGSAVWVGFTALPIACVWSVAALRLWRAYPGLLLRATAGPGGLGADVEGAELIDPTTVRALAPRLVDPDPDTCRLAVALVSEARAELAARALARAAADAPESTRAILMAALDRVLESAAEESIHSDDAAQALVALLEDPDRLSDRDRAAAVRAVGLLAGPKDDEARRVLHAALEDPALGVRTAAVAALCRRGEPPAGFDLDQVLSLAVESADDLTRRVAREELRAVLLANEPDERWGGRLTRLTALLSHRTDRAPAAAAVADVSARHGHHAVIAADAMLHLRDDEDALVQAAVLRFSGRAGLQSEAPWLVEHVAAQGFEGAEQVRAAATEGLMALGPRAADVLLVELSCGKRSTRDAILPIVRELQVGEDTLRTLYGRELESIRRSLVYLAVLYGNPGVDIVTQRLDERVAEASHTALLLLAAIRDEDRIAELGELLRRADGRQRAILIEALEALLGGRERTDLLPLLESRGASSARQLGLPLPSYEQTSEALLEDPDELTRALAQATFGEEGRRARSLAGRADLGEDAGMLSPVEIMLHLKSLPIFEHLTTRQLMDLAKVVGEETIEAGTVVVQEGDTADCMYLIVDGEVEVVKGQTPIREMGARSFFGEMAVFEGALRSASVVAKTRVRLLELKRDDLFRMMEELPAIAIAICRTMSKRVRQLTEASVSG